MIAPTSVSSRASSKRGARLDQRLRPEGVADLGPVDRDLGDPVGLLVADVLVLAGALPLDRRVELLLGRGVLVAFGHDGHDIRPMKLDDWLAQRSQSCPDRTALVADGAEVTYAELEAEATWVARRLAAHGVRRGSTAALTMHPRREQVVLVHALMKVGAVLLPLEPAADRGRAGGDRRRRGADRRPRRRRRADPDRGRPAAARRARHGRRLLPGPDQRQHRRAATRSASPTATSSGARSAPAFNIGVEPDRPLALLPAAQPHLRARDRRCARSSTAPPRSSTTASTSTASRAALERRRDHRRLAGGDDADPAARGRRRPLRPAGDPGRRRAGARGAAGGGDRPRAPPWSRPTA